MNTKPLFFALIVALLAFALAACNSGQNTALEQTQAELAAASNRIAELEESLSAVEAQLSPIEGEAASVRTQLEDMSDEEIANHVWQLVHDENYDFLWHYETDQPPGFYEGSEPHGAILQTFMNNIAFDAAGSGQSSFPPGSIFVKENYTPDNVLDAKTIMVKIDGYNPDAGDWFWAKFAPDGAIDVAGKATGCIGCHTQVADNNFVYDASLQP